MKRIILSVVAALALVSMGGCYADVGPYAVGGAAPVYVDSYGYGTGYYGSPYVAPAYVAPAYRARPVYHAPVVAARPAYGRPVVYGPPAYRRWR